MKQRDTLKDSLLHFMRILWDLIVLNWLWFFCSLPIITIGPASCGLFCVMLKLARGESVSSIKDFFRGFRDNFKPGLILGVIILVLVALAYGDGFFALQQTGLFRTVYLVLATVLVLAALTFACYGFALQAMFKNPLKTQIKNAFSLAFIAPGKTIMMWLITAFPVAAALLLPQLVVQMLGFLYLIFGFSGPAYLNSRILRDIFDKVNGSPVIEAPPEED